MISVKQVAVFVLLCASLSACGGDKRTEGEKKAPEKTPRPEMVFVIPTPSAETKSQEEQFAELLAAKKLSKATELYIDACASGPKKGFGPAFSFTSAFPSQAVKQLRASYSSILKDADSDQTRLRCIVAALARHPNPKLLQDFWREQLKTKDQQIRWWAVLELSEIADKKDLPLILAQAIEVPNLGALLTKRLVQWKDPRAVPFLYDLAKNSDSFSAKRAKRSLTTLGYSDVLTDKDKYEKEFAWWESLRTKHSPIEDIKQPWRTDARSVPKKSVPKKSVAKQ